MGISALSRAAPAVAPVPAHQPGIRRRHPSPPSANVDRCAALSPASDSMTSMMKLRLRLQATYRRSLWRRHLDGHFAVGSSTRLAGASLVVRDPADCRLVIGEGSDVGGAIVFEAAGARVEIGDRTHVGGGSLLDAAAEIVVGDDVLIAFGALLIDHDSHSLDFTHRSGDVADWIDGRKDW